MLIRYGIDNSGNSVPVAKVYQPQDHRISIKQIDYRAVKIIKQLKSAQYEAYLVGGAVRDLLLGQDPKDFDIVTNARPEQVRKLFRNSRIIGRRFKLVHVYFGKTNIEVATFRSEHAGNHINDYGTIESDVWRRDFSINALYYDPIDGIILDYVNGMDDFSQRVVRSLIPLKESFKEDPVRMLRGVKYSVTTGFELPKKEAKQIRSQSRLLGTVSSSRMTEEVLKILGNFQVAELFSACLQYKLLTHMLPALESTFKKASSPLWDSLKKLGSIEEPSRWQMFYYLTKDSVVRQKGMTSKEQYEDTVAQIKNFIKPLTPPNADVERGAKEILKGWGVATSGIKKRRPPRGSKGSSQATQKSSQK